MPPAASKLRLLVRHSAAPKDVALAEELLGHLRPLERFAEIDVWSEARIRPGDDWRKETHRAIQRADVALVLLSADFLNTDRLMDVEVPLLLERSAAGQLRVIPVLLRSCLWEYSFRGPRPRSPSTHGRSWCWGSCRRGALATRRAASLGM